MCNKSNGRFLLLFLMLKLEAELKVEWFHFLGRMKINKRVYLYKGERILTAIILAWCERSCKNFLWKAWIVRDIRRLCRLLASFKFRFTPVRKRPERMPHQSHSCRTPTPHIPREQQTDKKTYRLRIPATAFIQQTLHKNYYRQSFVSKGNLSG